MSKEIILGKESREKLMEGVNILADAVVCTLGPHGRNVVISRGMDGDDSTKDGVTVAESIDLEDNTQNLGARLVKQAAIKTHVKAGDGTTTSTLLAREMIKRGIKHLNNGENAVEISKDIKKTVQGVIKTIQQNISKKIENKDQIKQVAVISSNGDEEVGEMISQAMDQVKLDGVVYIEESKSGKTYLENVEGIQFDRGYSSPYFVTNNDNMTTVLEDPYILLIDGALTKVKELLPILSEVSAQQKSLLVIADDIAQEALATLVVNKQRGILNVCAVKAPEFGDRRKLILEDIAILTGGKVFSPDKAMKLDNFSHEWFGTARKITIEKEQTTIIDGAGKEEDIEERINQLQKQIDLSESLFETEKLQERVAKFIGGVAIIHVGGNTETEMRERKDRVDDALNATRAAIEEGIIPGGGAALLYARESIFPKTIGEQIVYDACGMPFTQILINAGFSEAEAVGIGKYDLIEKFGSNWDGYDLKSGKVVNMDEAGIIDPTKVARVALENAASVAGIVLLTECSIVDIPGTSKHDPASGIDLSQFGM